MPPRDGLGAPDEGPGRKDELARDAPVEDGLGPDEATDELDPALGDDGAAEEDERGLAHGADDEVLPDLEDDASDDDATHGGHDDDLALEIAEDSSGPEDDAPGPRAADDHDDLPHLEDESGEDDAAPAEDDEDDEEVAAHDRESGDDDQGSEGIAGDDPADALEDAPALDGGEGEGEGLGEALPELEEDPQRASARAATLSGR